MTTLTEQQFRDRPADVIDRVRIEGRLTIECVDGTRFDVIRNDPPAKTTKKSPLDVGTVPGLHLTIEEIVDSIREGREREGR